MSVITEFRFKLLALYSRMSETGYVATLHVQPATASTSASPQPINYEHIHTTHFNT